MASIVRRKTASGVIRYRAKVKRVGFKDVSKTFSTVNDAKKWSRKLERQIDIGDLNDYSEASKLLLSDIIKRFVAEGKHKDKKDQANIDIRIKNILKDSISDLNLLRLSTKHVAEWRDRVLKRWSPNTFNNHKSLLSVIIDTAITEWGIYMPVNPCRSIKRVPIPKARERVLTLKEYDRLMHECSKSDNIYLKPLVQFCLETACRQGEALSLMREHVNWNKKTCTFYDTKNGDNRTVALSETAFFILTTLPKTMNGKVFPFKNRDEVNWFWKVAVKKAGIDNFVYHDLRRTACSWLFEFKNLSVPEVQLMSGHRDPRVLLNIYTKLDPQKLVEKLA
jgi:integrase